MYVDCKLQGRRACQKPLGLEALNPGHSVCFAVVVVVVGAISHSSLALVDLTKGYRNWDRKVQSSFALFMLMAADLCVNALRPS